MNVILPIPDDLAASLSSDGADLARRALEAFGLEEHRAGRLTAAELGRLLGFGSRDALDGFLKAHGLYDDYAVEDFEREGAVLKTLGL